MNKAKARGTKWENACRDYLRQWWPDAERLALAGKLDKGDLSGVPATIECKALNTLTLAKCMKELRAEMANGGKKYGAVFFKQVRHGVEDGYAMLPISVFVEMLREIDGR